MKIRRAGPDDAEAIRDLTRKAYAKWIPSIGREPRPMTADYRKAVIDHWIDVFEDEQGMSGLIEIIPGPAHLVIENLAVREDRQGAGLATMLLRHAEDLARQQGIPELRLYTNAAFASNLEFYRARGFAETERTKLPDGGSMVHFAKQVS